MGTRQAPIRLSRQVEGQTRSQELIGCRFERFDEDQLRQLLADGEAGIANLADEIGLAGEETDDLIFAKAELAQPVLKFGGGAKLFNTDCYAGLDTGQGAKLAPSLFRARFNCLQPTHNQLPRISRLRRILTTHFLARGDHKLRGLNQDGAKAY